MRDNNEAVLKTFPDSRIFTLDMGELGKTKHHIPALLEIDVTKARELLRNIKQRDGKGLSFSAWLIKCISIALSEFPEAHAFLKNRKNLLIFNDIDVSLTVEKTVNGYRVPLPYVIRRTNRKSLLDIHNEIRAAQEENADDGKVVIGQKSAPFYMKLFLSMPAVLRRLVWKLILLKPMVAKKNMGSVMFTSVGMFGTGDGWIIPTSIHPICFAIGTTVKKPGVVDDSIAVREYLKMTVLIDHDVIDGAPAARFLSRLDELLRTADGLENL